MSSSTGCESPAPGVVADSAGPTKTQLDRIAGAFRVDDMIAHLDNGQYGGGNMVPYHVVIDFRRLAGVVDFYDIKLGGDGESPNFDALRYHIWHYVIVGDHWADSSEF